MIDDYNKREMDYFWDKIQYEDYRGRKYSRIRKVIFLYVILGFITFIFGTSYFIIDQLDLTLSTPENLSLIIGFIGLGIATFSSAYLAYLSKFNQSDYSNSIGINSSVFTFLETWQKFEKLSRKLIGTEDIRPEAQIKPLSIREIIKVLDTHEILEHGEYHSLIRALQLRNYIVHNDINSSNEELENYINLLERINIRIFDVMNRPS